MRKELVKLMKNQKKAAILGQLLYWTERVRSYKGYMREETERYINDEIEPKQTMIHGWIYKSANELSEETMLELHETTIRRHIKVMVKEGWIEERNNPKMKMDRTKQYRVNLVKIQRELEKMNLSLTGYERLTEPLKKATYNATEKETTQQGKNAPENRNTAEVQKSTTAKAKKKAQETIKQNEKESPAKEERTIADGIIEQIEKQTYADNEKGDAEIKEMIKISIEDIISSNREISRQDKTRRRNEIKKLTPEMIEYTLRKFKSIDKSKIRSPHRYFTTMLYTTIFEYKAVQVAGCKKVSGTEMPTNRFHNFDQVLCKLSEAELETIGRKKFIEKYEQLKSRRQASEI